MRERDGKRWNVGTNEWGEKKIHHFKHLHYEIEDVNSTIAKRVRKRKERNEIGARALEKKRLASSKEAEKTRLHTLDNIKTKGFRQKNGKK